jgi:TatD DNase family protein
MVHSCVEPKDFPAMQAIADRFPEVSLAVGLHPLDVDQWGAGMAAEIGRLARSDHRVVAIGETGLDFYKVDNAEVQREAFWAQLTLASQMSLPVIIHCRDAAQATAQLIREFQEAQFVPDDRLLIETDCRFLSPEPMRRERRNQPAFVGHVARFLAELRQVDAQVLADITTRNAWDLFQWSDPIPTAEVDTSLAVG